MATKCLTRDVTLLYHFKDENKVIGSSSYMTDDCTGLRGNCTGLRGNCTGLIGDCTGLIGDLDSCGIADEERVHGIDISTLVS